MMSILAYVLHRAMAQQKTMDSAKMTLSLDEIQSDKDIIINFFGSMAIYTSAGVLHERDFNSPKSSRVATYLMLNRKSAHSPLEIVEAYIMMDRKVKHGEIYCYDFGEHSGSVQAGRRPVLVVQADNFNEHSPTTVIAAISSAHKCKYLPSHIFLGEEFGLTQPSVVLLEQIRTVNQNELGAYIGIVDDGDMLNAISNGLKKTLGMWRYQTVRTETRCLCGRCLQEYMDTRAYIISRLDPFQKQKDSCDRCGKPGYDYTLKERRKKF